MVEFLDESLETNQSTESTEGNLKEDKGGDSNVQGEGDDSENPVDKMNKPGKSSEVADNEMKPETDDDIIDGNIKTFDKSAKSTSNAAESKTEEKDQNLKRENEVKESELTRDAKTIDPSSSINGTPSVNGEAGPSSAETTTEETKVPDASESSTVNGPERETRDKVENTVAQIPSIASMVSSQCFPFSIILLYIVLCKPGPSVQSIILKSSLRGHLIKCFTTLKPCTDIF